MKKIYKSIFLFLMVTAITVSFTFCSKDKDKGVPSISYVRITKPASSDSLLIGASQGSLIAIIGENLQDARQIWFNDLKATLTPTYITSNSIIVTVPSLVPNVITNTLKIIFSNGDSLKYKFEMQIHEPVINSMNCEYVLENGIATIHGNYFYKPLVVTFSGGVTGEIITLADELLTVKVPAGAQPGQITISSNFGSTKSDFWFRDNRNIFIGTDPYEGWDSGKPWIVSNPSLTDPPAINGNYIRVTTSFGDWPWLEVVNGNASACPSSKNIPDDAIKSPKLYNLKFEVNTLKPYNANLLLFAFAVSGGDQGDYQWKPPFDTGGAWQTVVIPFEEVMASYKAQVPSADGYYTRIVYHGTGTLNCDMCFDNFRVVLKVLKK